LRVHCLGASRNRTTESNVFRTAQFPHLFFILLPATLSRSSSLIPLYVRRYIWASMAISGLNKTTKRSSVPCSLLDEKDLHSKENIFASFKRPLLGVTRYEVRQTKIPASGLTEYQHLTTPHVSRYPTSARSYAYANSSCTSYPRRRTTAL
jgi:hypothetical protein